ncbi:hypothetical protein SUGI_0794370 [Cryptomeria japonica]|uniref:heavy metal-associated isoprenylated plant protein 12 n=1 Tax=Cryptomeria japonica TaxID=3369 RepID=UPI002414BC2F|nr:heavy metal-associated isoprenylated plant protein 12 [Cryptomeria japonica]GLJ38966.1 hypothetical protein SUGI_0794370 [Cryptomeria japonica]
MKKIVLKSEINCEKCKQKVMKTIARVPGVNSVSIDLKEQKITVIGDADPVVLTTKLKMSRYTELMSVGAYKEEKSNNPKEEVVEVVYVDVPTRIFQYHSYVPGGMYSFSDENPNACSIS